LRDRAFGLIIPACMEKVTVGFDLAPDTEMYVYCLACSTLPHHGLLYESARVNNVTRRVAKSILSEEGHGGMMGHEVLILDRKSGQELHFADDPQTILAYNRPNLDLQIAGNSELD